MRNNPGKLNGNERRRLYQQKCVGLAFELGQARADLARTQEQAAKLLARVSELEKVKEETREASADVPGAD